MQLLLRHSSLAVARNSAIRLRVIVTSAQPISTTAVFKPFVSVSPMQSVRETALKASTRIQGLTKQLSTSLPTFAQITGSTQDHNMASDNASSQNNAAFQLSELFNVKDKVALITGMCRLNASSNVLDAQTNMSQVAAPALG